MCGILQKSIFGQVLFNTLTGGIDNGIELTFSKSVDDTKLTGTSDASDDRDAIQRYLGRLDRWAPSNHIKYIKTYCKVTPGLR